MATETTIDGKLIKLFKADDKYVDLPAGRTTAVGGAVIEVTQTPRGCRYRLKASRPDTVIHHNRVRLDPEATAMLNFGDGVIIDGVPYQFTDYRYTKIAKPQ